MPFVFSHVEYCDMHFVYGYCDGSARMQVLRTLHEEDLHPHHDQTVQHVEPGDHVQRMELCDWIQANPELL